ncbi:MAG: aspartate aminotransferase family protein [Phycisphaeraceae bacterium]|nr:aspartate aminotransferase family protein [Phycisphaeraceae bacterium]
MAPRHMSPDEFRRRGREMVDFIADYMERVDSLPVLSRVRPGEVAAGLPDAAPEQPEPWDVILADVQRIIMPGITHWQSPNFFAFFPANSSGPAILADLLSTGLAVQGMMWQTSPACTEIETRVLDWLGRAIGLPETFLSASGAGGGVIQSTASEATLVAMLAGRERARLSSGGPAPGGPALRTGSNSSFTIYTSTQAHSSVIKAAMIAGIAKSAEDRAAVRLIPTDSAFRMDCDALERALREDLAAGRVPCCVVATVGTTGCGAFDPLDNVAAAIARAIPDPSHRPWLHVDAAWAGAALVCPEHQTLIRGVEQADSFCFNPHKWLLTNFDCSAMWVRDRAPLLGALSITPEYLRNAASESGAVIDYRDWQIPLGRRFRALKLWFVMRAYGLSGLREHIRVHVRLGAVFESLVRADDRFEIAAPRAMSLICFRQIRDAAGATLTDPDGANRALLDRVNAGGRAYLVHTVLPATVDAPARLVLRMAIGGTRTREEHVRAAWDLLRSAAA